MTRLKLNLVLGLAVGGCLVGGVFGQATQKSDKQANVSQEKGKEGAAGGVSLLNQASQLVRYARENESPVAMLAAVQILNTVRVQEGSERFGNKKTGPLHPGEQVKEGQKGNAAMPTLDAKALLAEARPWAVGNANVTALLNAEMNKAKSAGGGTLGLTRGLIEHKDTVRARDYDDFEVQFLGGEVARIAVVGDGSTDIDLIVYDQNGNEITRDDDRTSNCVVSFTPRWTGPFRVRIVNNGYVPSNYLLMTN